MAIYTIGRRIKQARKHKGLNQGELARAVGLKGQSHISMIERGERPVTQELIIALCNALGVGPDWLLNGKNAPSWSPEYWGGTNSDRMQFEVEQEKQQVKNALESSFAGRQAHYAAKAMSPRKIIDDADFMALREKYLTANTGTKDLVKFILHADLSEKIANILLLKADDLFEAYNAPPEPPPELTIEEADELQQIEDSFNAYWDSLSEQEKQEMADQGSRAYDMREQQLDMAKAKARAAFDKTSKK